MGESHTEGAHVGDFFLTGTSFIENVTLIFREKRSSVYRPIKVNSMTNTCTQHPTLLRNRHVWEDNMRRKHLN